MKMKNSYWFLLSFLILLSFVTGASSQEMTGRSPSGGPEVALGPTDMPGLSGWSGSQAGVIVIDEPKDPVNEEEDIKLGDTGEPGLGGLTGAETLIPVSVSDNSDEKVPESSEPLGDTGKPGLGGISGSSPKI